MCFIRQYISEKYAFYFFSYKFGSYLGFWSVTLQLRLVASWFWDISFHFCFLPLRKKNRDYMCDFELWWWRRFLRVPWIAGRSNQSILKEISPEYSLEGLMLKLKLQYIGTWCKELTHWKRPWWWERLKVGEGDDRRWDGWMASLTRWAWVWVNSESWWTGRPGVLQSVGSQRVGHDWATKLNKLPPNLAT